MIIYTVCEMDLLDPKIKFSTLNKEKAEKFVNEYNKYHNDNIDSEYDKYYINIIDTDQIDKNFDEIIQSYRLKRITKININKFKQSYTIDYTRLKYIDINKYYDSAEILDYENDYGTWNRAQITLITDSTVIPNINDKDVILHISELIENNIKYLQYLYAKY